MLVVDDVVGLSVRFALDGQSVGSGQIIEVNDTPIILAFAKDTQLPFLQGVVEGLLEQPTRPGETTSRGWGGLSSMLYW
jgi:hypothetical protein